ncbi:uncharacterized protein B0H18DRAFT_36075 [Fomitopsis serialis]|uniref:uncharacterized protein n=1 Tax=Fomitopsis serialis TaxID=139415 RepID=UPI002007219E|nr:uncharacterized protein B0H18DRAFT_36075 [Neoantrodia serialis]KAH9917414.1 hypothetical protein B0H18DRAFT_36075 [Neoantrodia serialis]
MPTVPSHAPAFRSSAVLACWAFALHVRDCRACCAGTRPVASTLAHLLAHSLVRVVLHDTAPCAGRPASLPCHQLARSPTRPFALSPVRPLAHSPARPPAYPPVRSPSRSPSHFPACARACVCVRWPCLHGGHSPSALAVGLCCRLLSRPPASAYCSLARQLIRHPCFHFVSTPADVRVEQAFSTHQMSHQSGRHDISRAHVSMHQCPTALILLTLFVPRRQIGNLLAAWPRIRSLAFPYADQSPPANQHETIVSERDAYEVSIQRTCLVAIPLPLTSTSSTPPCA